MIHTKHITTVLAAIFLLSGLLLSSCKKDEKDELEGKWLLQEVTNEEGVTHRVDTVWYNFQNTLFMYQLYDEARESNQFIHQYGYKSRDEVGNVIIEFAHTPRNNKDFLPYTDWTEATRLFSVDKVSGSRLILSSEGKSYSFEKF